MPDRLFFDILYCADLLHMNRWQLWKDVSNCGFFGSIITFIHIFVSTLFRKFELNYANYALQDIPQEMEPLQIQAFYLHLALHHKHFRYLVKLCIRPQYRFRLQLETSEVAGFVFLPNITASETQAPLWPPLQEVTVSLSAVGSRGSVSVFLHSCCRLPHHIAHSLHSSWGLPSSVCWPLELCIPPDQIKNLGSM